MSKTNKPTTPAERQAKRRGALNLAADLMGFESWTKFETAVIRGQIVLQAIPVDEDAKDYCFGEECKVNTERIRLQKEVERLLNALNGIELCSDNRQNIDADPIFYRRVLFAAFDDVLEAIERSRLESDEKGGSDDHCD